MTRMLRLPAAWEAPEAWEAMAAWALPADLAAPAVWAVLTASPDRKERTVMCCTAAFRKVWTEVPAASR